MVIVADSARSTRPAGRAQSLEFDRKSGRTPPVLLWEIKTHNPRLTLSTGYNVFRDDFIPADDETTQPTLAPKGACLHSFVTKANQCCDSKIASTCTRCRIRISLSVQNSETPCGEKDYPFHFLVLRETYGDIDTTKAEPGSELYHFGCIICLSEVLLEWKPPVLTAEDLTLLTDERLIKERANAAIAAAPDLTGFAAPSPAVVVDNLRRYISNIMDGTAKRSSFPTKVKRFQLSFGLGGEPCGKVLRKLGFERSADKASWNTPVLDSDDIVPYSGENNVFLDDVEMELKVLLQARPQGDVRDADIPNFTLRDSSLEFIQVLRSEVESSHTKAADSQAVLNFYKHLGIPTTMDNDFVDIYYELQSRADPYHAPYYLRCLQRIGKSRNSAGLLTYVLKQNEEGLHSDTDIRDAYQYFGFGEPFSSHEDDTIIGTFRARLADDPLRESDMRQKLRTIASWRQSEAIREVAEDLILTYNQALNTLGVFADTHDDFVMSAYTSKASESAKSAETAKKALEIIAEERHSAGLKTFLRTGSVPDADMDVGQAYNHFGIDDRTIDDDLVIAVFESVAIDAPGRVDEYRRALSAIARDRGSMTLHAYLSGGLKPTQEASEEMPVGLNNIGNTCYLNSLLQYLFTIAPFREMILHIENFLEPDPSVEKIVGSRKVSQKEIERSQKFVLELKKLFNDMIASPIASITPTREMARLALLSASAEETIEQIRRSSVTQDGAPALSIAPLGQVEGLQVQGPVGPPSPEDDTKMGSQLQSPNETILTPATDDTMDTQGDLESKTAEKNQESSDAMSEATLVDHDVTMTDGTQSIHVAEDAIMDDVTTKDDESSQMPPPERPPPVPPRPSAERKKSIVGDVAVKDELMFGAQQDMPEVLGNILFQTSCAIKGSGKDSSGEQIDKIKELFYGKMKSYIVEADGKKRSTEQLFCDIKMNMNGGPEDIYTTLAGAFDAEEISVNGASAKRYSVMSSYPPVLQLQVQRVQYDAVKKSAFKAQDHLKLRETIYMDRFLDFEKRRPDLEERRSQSWAWKAELQQCVARRKKLLNKDDPANAANAGPANGLIALKHLQTITEDDDDDYIVVDPPLIDGLEALSAETEQELKDLDILIRDLERKIETQFTDCRAMPYRLQTVFMHRGSHLFGHYWTYIYDFERDIWRRYNDGYVEEVRDLRYVFEPNEVEKTKDPSTTYCAVYVHDSRVSTLVSALNRNIGSRTAGSAVQSPMEEGPRPALPPRRSGSGSGAADHVTTTTAPTCTGDGDMTTTTTTTGNYHATWGTTANTGQTNIWPSTNSNSAAPKIVNTHTHHHRKSNSGSGSISGIPKKRLSTPLNNLHRRREQREQREQTTVCWEEEQERGVEVMDDVPYAIKKAGTWDDSSAYKESGW